MSIVWEPSAPENSQMWQFMRVMGEKYGKKFDNYSQLYQWSIDQPALFWQGIAEFFHIEFITPPQSIMDSKQSDHPMLDINWFDQATLNYADILLRRRDNHLALVCVNENGDDESYTYKQLYLAVAACAQGLRNVGVVKGDRVAAIMPNVAYTVIAFLATASIGAIWSSCSPDFGAQTIIDRLSQIEPKVLFMANGHQYMGKVHSANEKMQLIHQAIPSLEQTIICPVINDPLQLPAKTQLWNTFIQPSETCEFEPLSFSDPLYILFSSGTTGKPKCIVHGIGGSLLQHVKELGLHTDIKADDNLCFYTTCGWMMWNWMVSVLALGATLTLYEGAPSYLTINRLFQVIENKRVSVFGTSAKFLSTLQKEGANPGAEFDLSALRTILSTGSPLLPKNYDFVYERISPSVQLSSISGGTDIVSCFALGNPLLPVYRGELQCLGLGMAVEVYNQHGESVQREHGELVCTKPFPCMPLFFWNDRQQQAYRKAYFERFPNVWAHGDFAEITSHQGLIIYGRSDAILNPGGVRIGTAEIYHAIENLQDIADSVIIGQPWQDDVRVVLFVKLAPGKQLDAAFIDKIKQTIRKNASPRHVPAKILQAPDIPRTINGKLVEVAVKNMVQGLPITNRESLANPEALDYFRDREELRT